jgi:predicted secreted protein
MLERRKVRGVHQAIQAGMAIIASEENNATYDYELTYCINGQQP